MISASALGVYLYILSARPSISAKNLSKTFNEGRDAIATYLRALLVPALMRLFGERNWWAPKALKRFQINH